MQNITVEEWIERWFTDRVGQWNASTEGGYRNLIYRHIIPDIGKTKLSELTAENVQLFYGRLIENGLSTRSVWCVHLVTERGTPAMGSVHILTIHKGRAVEQCELVDYGGTTREILLPQATVTLLEQEHLRHPSSPYMFPHPGTQKPYSPNMVRLLHNRIIERSGLDHIRFTDLRHTYSVLSLWEGVELSTLTKTLGLARRYMTMKNYEMYLPGKGQNAPVNSECDPSSEDLRLAADKLGNLLNHLFVVWHYYHPTGIV